MKLRVGDAWAQLILIPYVLPAGGKNCQRIGGFGSTDQLHPQIAAVLQHIQAEKPKRWYQLNGKSFEGILDSSADVSVISEHQWPAEWPTEPAPAVWGVSGPQVSKQSTQ